ncbi:hypothetical protein A616_17180 [Brevibacillus brevis X23]|nr:hypothetical protein A616_17180 [Brevibacillus brevis X23]
MKKVLEYTKIGFHYESEEERNEHVKSMESEGWECSGQGFIRTSNHTDKFVWTSEFAKRAK